METEPPVFSIICVSHKPEVLNRWLRPSVESQTLSHEFRVVDPGSGQYPSCAAALNAGAQGARGRYLLFVHHDVAWDGVDFLSKLQSMLDALPELGIAGVVGASDRFNKPRLQFRNAVLEGDPDKNLLGNPIDAPEEVQTLDELLLIVPSAVFRQMPFDAQTCDDWHLYGVDYSLSVPNIGLKAYVLPLIVRHLSGGSLNRGYYRTLDRVRRKHRARFRQIATTCGTWGTRGPDGIQRTLHGLRWYGNQVKGLVLRMGLAIPDWALPGFARRMRQPYLKE